MLERLASSRSDGAEVMAEVVARVSAAVSEALGTVSITSLTQAIVPTYALVGSAQALLLRVHGAAAEWLLVPRPDSAPLLRDAAERAPADALLTASQGGEPVAAARLTGGELRTAVRAGAQSRLSETAPGTLDDAILWLLDACNRDPD